MDEELKEILMRFFLEDVGGILITDGEGNTLFEDARARLCRQGSTNWAAACPRPREGQRGERWDLLNKDGARTYLVITSTLSAGGQLRQLHHLVESSEYTELFRDISDYSRTLRHEKEHDGLTGLFNQGKFMALKESLFRKQETLAVFNLDVNDLKYVNDNFGHEAGDALIKKAAESLKRIERRNVLVFRIGGDEFLAAALYVSREDALALKERWEAGLRELNAAEDGIPCTIACGFAYGEKGFDLEALLAEADRNMYEDKKKKKSSLTRGNEPFIERQRR